MIRGPPTKARSPSATAVRPGPGLTSRSSTQRATTLCHTIYPKGEAMRKTIVTLALAASGLGLGLGIAAADTTTVDQTSDSGSVVVTQSQSSTVTGSSDCLPADVLAQMPPWLLIGSVPTCP